MINKSIVISALISALIIWGTNLAFSQKHDYTYVQKCSPDRPGSGTIIKSIDSLNDIQIERFTWSGTVSWSPVFSNKNGELLFFTNNINIYDSIGRKAINGNDIAVGEAQNWVKNTAPDGKGLGVGSNAGIIPITDSLFYLFHKSSEVFPGLPGYKFLYEVEKGSIVNGYSDGLYLTKLRLRNDGRIYLRQEEKKELIIDDLFEFKHLSFVKKARNDGWWIICPKILNDSAYRISLSEQGVINEITQIYYSPNFFRVKTDSEIAVNGIGDKIARVLIRHNDTCFKNILELFNFDRCTGQLTRYFVDSFPLPENYTPAGDIEFSPNGRFLYIAYGSNILQIDLDEDNFFENRDTIGVWDGFYYGVVPPLFDNLWTLPNGKILVAGLTSEPFLHYIHEPDRKGDSCLFEQRAIMLEPDPYNPPFHVDFCSLPTYPPYRMPPIDGDCTTSSQDNLSPNNPVIQVYPNPASNYIIVDNVKDREVIIFNNLGKVVKNIGMSESYKLRIDLTDFPSGIYNLVLTDKSTDLTQTNKVVVIR